MYTKPARILIVDDDVELVTLLIDYFTLEGFEAVPAHNGIDALEAIKKNHFDLVVLDVMMPEMTGTEVLTAIRQISQIPVLMLTAKGDPVDRILGLELGADDYVPKPCPPRELVARIRAILRRGNTPERTTGPITLEPLCIDMACRRVTVYGHEVNMTGTEMALLDMLARQVGSPVPKSDIYPKVLGRPMGRYDRAIDVHISSIRRKLLEFDVKYLIRIESIRGVGYQLIVLPDCEA